MNKRDAYIEKMKSQLDKLNLEISNVENKANEAKVEARVRYHAEIGNLRDQSKAATHKLEEMKLSGEDVWEGMVAEMEKIRVAFTSSLHYFKSQI